MQENMRDGIKTLITVLGFAAVLAMPVAIWGWLREPSWKLKTQAIERGYALYCPLNGKWAWAGECETQKEQP